MLTTQKFKNMEDKHLVHEEAWL